VDTLGKKMGGLRISYTLLLTKTGNISRHYPPFST